MVTLSRDVRQRIMSTCDQGEGTQESIARGFGVSHAMVKKLKQRQKTGCIKPRHHLAGRKNSSSPSIASPSASTSNESLT